MNNGKSYNEKHLPFPDNEDQHSHQPDDASKECKETNNWPSCHGQCSQQIAAGAQGCSPNQVTSSTNYVSLAVQSAAKIDTTGTPAASSSSNTAVGKTVNNNYLVSHCSKQTDSADNSQCSTNKEINANIYNERRKSALRKRVNSHRSAAAPNKIYRSGPSEMYSYVCFINCTKRMVDVVWVNYDGIGVHYKTLLPGQNIDVNTFVGHPWVFRDKISGDRLVVDQKEVFEPSAWRPQDGWPAKRTLVRITVPVFTLREYCLQTVRKCIRRRDYIPDLEIPHELKEDLLELQPIPYSKVYNPTSTES